MQGTVPGAGAGNATAGNATAGWLTDGASAVQRALEELAATHGRLAASVVLLSVLFVGIVVFPVAFHRVREALVSGVTSGRTAGLADRLTGLVPTTFSGMLVRTSQLGLLALAAASFLAIWGVVDLAGFVDGLIDEAGPDLFDAAATLVLIAAAFAASDQLQRTIAGFSRRVERITEHQQEVLLRVGQVAIFVTVGAAVLGVWDVDLSGFLVGAGFLGIVVGFAARKTLGSLIAGFVLMFSRPFTIGDWVVIGDDEGVVTDITMFNTRLENFDGEFIVLPNDQVSDEPIVNRSRKGLLRLRRDVGIDYDADPDEAVDVAVDAMAAADEVVDAPAPQAVPKSFGDSAVVLELRFWIDHPTPPRKWQAVSAVVTAVTRAFADAGIDVPYPQRRLSVREGTTVDVGESGALADGPIDGGVDETVDGDAGAGAVDDDGDAGTGANGGTGTGRGTGPTLREREDQSNGSGAER